MTGISYRLVGMGMYTAGMESVATVRRFLCRDECASYERDVLKFYHLTMHRHERCNGTFLL